MAFINYVTQIQIDFGAIQLLKQECERVGIHKPLIVSDQGVKAAGILQKALDALPGFQVAVFDQTPSNPTEAAVRAASEVYKAQGCDGLIAVGGGSSIDCAKCVSIAVTHEGPLKTYATIEGGSLKITDRVAPIIAVPTTSGTGSEVARSGEKLDVHRVGTYCEIVDWNQLPNGLLGITAEGRGTFQLVETWRESNQLCRAVVRFRQQDAVSAVPVEVAEEFAEYVDLLKGLSRHPAIADLKMDVSFDNLREVAWRLTPSWFQRLLSRPKASNTTVRAFTALP